MIHTTAKPNPDGGPDGAADLSHAEHAEARPRKITAATKLEPLFCRGIQPSVE